MVRNWDYVGENYAIDWKKAGIKEFASAEYVVSMKIKLCFINSHYTYIAMFFVVEF